MTYVVTQNCCNDASCVSVCPVDCIHPGPDEPGYGTADMLYIDPAVCIDCGACADVCPVEAISPDDDLVGTDRRYLEINADYYSRPHKAVPVARTAAAVVDKPGPLRVAIVGSGPSACYAAEELLGRKDLGAEVTMIERLPFAGGLVRYGVAPDHAKTKLVERGFARTLGRPRATVHLGVDVGRDLTLDELAAHHHAVIVATGATQDRLLGVPGEELPGVHGAREFVAWYNGHPEHAEASFDLSHERAVVVGNGNVALDVARVLLSDVDDLRRTDIAEHALEALTESAVREVVVLGRRGPDAAACTVPELLGLSQVPGVDVVVAGSVDVSAGDTPYKIRLLNEYAQARPTHGRRIILRFHRTPQEILGEGAVRAVRLGAPDGGIEDLDAGLVLRSIGYRGTPFGSLPFDEASGTVVNVGGRVRDPQSGQPVVGRYVSGWIKRGPTGVIGTNRQCARETVLALLDDYAADLIPEPAGSGDDFAALVAERCPGALTAEDWASIDRYERSLGRGQRRPRVKLLDPSPALD